jgi:hypothetical protein
MMSSRALALVLLGLSSTATMPHAQVRPLKAEVTPVVETDAIRPGSIVRLALKVRLPENVHVQSDKPRDPSLIATVLTVEPPKGITVGGITYPPATDLKQAGQKQPLAVFEREFTIALRLNVASELAPGDIVVPARFRYQACDARVCYPPSTAETQWTITVVARQ